MIAQFGTFQRIFEFNHIDPAKKHPNYDNLIRRTISTEQLDEIDKCVLLCRICHGIAHQQNVNAEVMVRVKAGGRQIEQRFKGQLIRNFITRKSTFFTDEKVLLHPYRVFAGQDMPRIVFGLELWKGEMISLIRRLSDTTTLRITSWDDKPLLEMEYDGDGGYRAKQDISFPVFECEFHKEKNDPVLLWVRNGIGLTRDGEVLHNGLLNYEAKIVR
jgi:hypothetical protein